MNGNGTDNAAQVFAQIEHARGRAKIYNGLMLCSYLGYPLALFLLYYSSEVNGGITAGMGLAALALVGSAAVFSRIFHRKAVRMSREFYGFEDTFKALVVEEEVAKLFADPVFKNPAYKPKEGLAQQRVRDLHLFAGFDRYSSDDWIEGGYKNIRFAHADVCLVGEREEEDSDGNKQMVDVTLFQGPVLRFTFDAAFPGSLRVISRRMAEINYSGCSKVTTMGKTRVTSAKMRGWAEITTEAEPFNKEFLSFAQDPVAAMRILKPQAIMKICSMVELFKHPLIFVFEGAEMFAFLHTGAPTFALSTNKDFERQRLQVDKDIEVILKFLDGMEDLLPDSDA